MSTLERSSMSSCTQRDSGTSKAVGIGMITLQLTTTTSCQVIPSFRNARGNCLQKRILSWSLILGMEFNFRKYRWGEIQNLSMTYDIGSVMHYPRYAFSKDRRYPTITPKDSSAQLQSMGQRDGFSPVKKT